MSYYPDSSLGPANMFSIAHRLPAGTIARFSFDAEANQAIVDPQIKWTRCCDLRCEFEYTDRVMPTGICGEARR